MTSFINLHTSPNVTGTVKSSRMSW